jgi:hypothetical protein
MAYPLIAKDSNGNSHIVGSETAIKSSPDKSYRKLEEILKAAYEQAANGKGKERHANGKPWEEQPMNTIANEEGIAFLTGQAKKKVGEARKLPVDMAIKEYLGAIVYLCGAIYYLETHEGNNG